MRLASLQCSLYGSGLEPNLRYLKFACMYSRGQQKIGEDVCFSVLSLLDVFVARASHQNGPEIGGTR